MWCVNCGYEISEDTRFCPQCGTPCRETVYDKTVKTEYEDDGINSGSIVCPTCGGEIILEDTFCSKCGARVSNFAKHKVEPENICPNCKSTYSAGDTFCSACGCKLASTISLEANRVIGSIRKILDYLKQYFLNPIAASCSIVEQSNNALAVSLFIIYALASGFQLYALMKCGCDMVSGLFADIFGVFVSSLSVKPPFLLCLLCGVLLSVVSIILYSAVYYLVAKILKQSCSIKSAIYACIANSILPALLLLAATPFFTISIWAGLAVSALAQLAWYILGLVGLNAVVPNPEDGKFWMLYIVGLCFAISISLGASWRIDWLAVKGISVSYDDESMTINEIMESEGIHSADEFIKSALEEVF